MSLSNNWQNSIIKGRIAETIVAEMLQEAGYFVYRFGYEGILQSLVQKGLPRMKTGDIEADKVRSMPDFLVMDKDGDVSFVEVKYRSRDSMDGSLKEWLDKANKYWPEAKLLMVRSSEPYFSISSVGALARTGKLYQLENDRFIKVEKKLVIRYTEFLKEYF